MFSIEEDLLAVDESDIIGQYEENLVIMKHDNMEELENDIYHLVPENIKVWDIILLEKISLYFHQKIEIQHQYRWIIDLLIYLHRKNIDNHIYDNNL